MERRIARASPSLLEDDELGGGESRQRCDPGRELPKLLVASSSLVARSAPFLFAEVLTDQGGQPDACLLQPLLHVRLELLLVRLARLPRLLDCITRAAARGR